MAAEVKSRPLARAGAVVAVMALVAALPALQAQQQARPKAAAPNDKKDKAAKRPGGLRVPVGAPPKKVGRRVDAVANATNADPTTAIVKFQLGTDNGDFLAASYYPTSRLDAATAPVVLLVHDKGRSSQDFEEPNKNLEGKSLAEKLRQEGYAVLLLDLRGHGLNPRPTKELTAKDWQVMTADLHAAYLFLLDRHNRRELNLAKFGVLGLGAGANLLAHWAAEPDAAVAAAPPNSDPRPTDLAAMVLVSPLAEASGMKLDVDLPLFAYRLPVILEAGENEPASSAAAKAVQKVVERNRQSKILLVPGSGLRSEVLLRLDAKAVEPLLKFLDATVKLRRDEWEGRFNLDPVAYRDVKLVSKPKAAEKEKEKEKEKAKEPEKAKDQDK
jgi:alpha-beta hydrolase superfamily lysophospholipase